MTTGKPHLTEDQQPERPRYIIRRIIIVLLIIGLGILGTRYLIKSKPKISKRRPERTAPLVNVVPLQPVTMAVKVKAMGTVVPSMEIVLKTPVGGEIIEVNGQFSPGGLLQQGDLILQIDPRDYELALEQKRRVLSDAEYAYKLEQGRQDVARQEWGLLYGETEGQEIESDLALRKPHLEKVEVDIKAAKADMELAEINLARTKVSAPFNSLVLNKYVDKGAFVAPQEKLAELVGTDEYWVQVSVPLNRLQWLKIPKLPDETGSTAKIFYREGSVRNGEVIRLQGELTKEGRMARLLVAVPDPLGLADETGATQPMIVGEYVRVELLGEELHDVFTIPRTVLHNDSEVWIATLEGKLDIREIRTIWRDEDHVLVQDGLQEGELLVLTNLAVPVKGMDLRVKAEQKQEEQ